MKRLVYTFVFAAFVSLLFQGCDPGTSTGNSGNPSSDSSTTTHPTDKGARPWAEDQNMLDPNMRLGVPDPLDESLMLFSAPFLKARQVAQFEVRSFSDADNPRLTEDVAEKDLTLSRRRVFTFDENGNVRELLEERFLGDVTPATSQHVVWTYLSPDKTKQIDFEEKIGSKKSTHQRKFTYSAKGELEKAEDGTVYNAYFGYDPGRQHTYILRIDPAKVAQVYVMGKEGDFPDSTCARIQEEILRRENNFVPHAAGEELEEVIFMETTGRKLVREVHMGKKLGEKDHVVERQFNADGNIAERKYFWDIPNADFKTLTKYRYSPTGDLIEIFHQSQHFNQPIVNEIDRYTYSSEGILQKHTRTTRTGQDTEEVV